jgi:dihydrofolate reductase
MRRIRYLVAMSLDGYIAGRKGDVDWIPSDPEIDFRAIFRQFDTILVGRRTFEDMAAEGRASTPGMKTIVFSRTLRRAEHPSISIMAKARRQDLEALKEARGKDIWLFGGGSLFRSLTELGVVDTVEVTVIPILLGGGVGLLAGSRSRVQLALAAHRVYKSGLISLEYGVLRKADLR